MIHATTPQAAYLALLNAEATDLTARQALVQAKAARLADTAGLFQALGGGWWNRDDASPTRTASAAGADRWREAGQPQHTYPTEYSRHQSWPWRFTSSGCQVATASLASEVRALIGRTQPDMIILSADFPDAGGVDLIRQVRGGTAAPLVILLWEQSSVSAWMALDAGADDCVPEPFLLEELAVRVRRLLRRPGVVQVHAALMTGGGILETVARNDTVMIHRRPVPLTRREAHLLGLLMGAKGATLSQDDIVQKVWGSEQGEPRQNLRRVISSLRRKLEKDPGDPRVIMSVRGNGYRINVLPDGSAGCADADAVGSGTDIL